MISPIILFQIARNGNALAEASDFSCYSKKSFNRYLKNIPSIKAQREFKAFKLKLKRKLGLI